MDRLNDAQRRAVFQLREIINGADEEVAVSVLETVDWDVQARHSSADYDLKCLPDSN